MSGLIPNATGTNGDFGGGGVKAYDVLVQIIFLYLITRDQLITTFISAHILPITATVQFRVAVLFLLAWMTLGTGRIGLWRGVGGVAWLFLATYGVFLLVEGLTVLISGGDAKTLVIVFIDVAIVLLAVGLVFSYASSRFRPKEGLRFLLQPYCYLAIYIAFAGLAAWLLHTLEIIDPEAWHLPDGVLPKDAEKGGHIYTMPYYLSLVLYDQGGGVFFNLSFRRASGLLQEPNTAAFFVAPMLFLLPLIMDYRERKWNMRIIYLVTAVFLFATHSVTGLVILTILSLLFLGRVILMHPQPTHKLLALVSLGGVAMIAWIVANSFGTINAKLLPGMKLAAIGYVGQDIANAVFGTDLLTGREGDFNTATSLSLAGDQRGIISIFTQFLHMGTVATLGLAMFLLGRTRWYAAGAVLYVLLHSLKSYGALFTSGMYLYLLLVFAVIVACYRNQSTLSVAAFLPLQTHAPEPTRS